MVAGMMMGMEHDDVASMERYFDAACALADVLFSAAISTAGKTAVMDLLRVRVGKMQAQLMGMTHDAATTADPGFDVVDVLHGSNRVTRSVARAQVRFAGRLVEDFPIIHDGMRDGVVSEDQAKGIIKGLLKAPAALTMSGHEQRQEEMLGFAAEFDPKSLEVLASRMAELTDPEAADDAEASRLEREARQAQAARSLTVVPDHRGSMLIRGQVPLADGEVLLAQLRACMPSRESYERESLVPAPNVRMADALIRLTTIAANAGELPAVGGDRPHAMITLDVETLKTSLGRITSITTGEQLSPGDARRLACEAEIIPVALGTASQPLDVGRSTRWFTGAVGKALLLRDQGCVFPDCDAPASACHRHHIIPWWNGGTTSLSNGVMICPYHHRLVEPDPRVSDRLQWQIRIDEDSGLPWFTPPVQVDPLQRPRLHQRHRLKGRTLPEREPQISRERITESDPQWITADA